MQTIFLEEEMRLIDGIAYEIDFSKDYSTICLDGTPVGKIPIPSLIESIVNFKDEDIDLTLSADLAENRWESQKFWKDVDKYEEKERKREEKWKHRYKPGKKERVQNYYEALDGIMNRR